MNSSNRDTSSAAVSYPTEAPAAVPSYQGLISATLETEGATERGWNIESESDQDGVWVRVEPSHVDPPAQGWKLHVSAAAPSAESVLRAALPVLLADGAPFKVAASDEVLDFLNNGEAGVSQVGKFITVYPFDDDQAVRLASSLHDATKGLRGPAVPYDRPVARGSLVHYRYGTFIEHLGQSAVGEVSPMIRGPEGELLPDRRTAPTPSWVHDPFEEAGLSAPPLSKLISGRYALTGTMHRSAGGAVRAAIDTKIGRPVVLKQAFRDARLGTDGLDARDHLRREAEILSELASNPRFPAVLDILEFEGDLFVALEQLEGTTLTEHMSAYVRAGRFVSNSQIVAWGTQLAEALGAVHDAGYIYRDMKSSNVIVGPDGRLRMIDFDFAYRRGSGRTPSGLGTRGYSSREQVAGAEPTVAGDVYGLGAVLYLIATGADPAEAPDATDLLTRPLELLNPGLSPEVRSVIETCLAPDAAGRFPTMGAVRDGLATALDVSYMPPVFGEERQPETPDELAGRARDMARGLADAIARTRRPPGVKPGQRPGGIARALDLNSGTAGVVLALADLVGEFGDAAHRSVLEAAAESVDTAPSLEGDRLPGLYVGESGVAAALLRAGLVLGDDGLVESARRRGRQIALAPHSSPDLFNGSAGRLRFHLFLFDATGDADQLDAAVAAGEFLLSAAQSANGEWKWTIPPGYEGLSGLASTGYAHGAAGIADALLELYEATSDERFLDGAKRAARWLARLSLPSLDDESGATWPEVEGGSRAGPTWCRGPAGIGRFWLHAASHDLLPEADDLAIRSARMIARGGRALDPSQCHGLSGNIEFLIDAANATGDESFLQEALSLARLLDAFAVEREGIQLWLSDEPNEIAPGYMTGFSGIAMCLLRLADPRTRPHQLSRAGFVFTRGLTTRTNK